MNLDCYIIHMLSNIAGIRLLFYWVRIRPATATTVKPERPMAKKTGSMFEGIGVPAFQY